MVRERLVSRTGCLSCRLRKTKCDEARPGCSTCARLRRECVYPERDPAQFGREAEAHRLRIRTAKTRVPVQVKAGLVRSQVPGEVGLNGFSDQICIAFTLHALFKTELSFTERGSSKSWLCLSALGVTFYGMVHKDSAALRKGRDLHSTAIDVMQTTIQDSAGGSSPDTLAAMVFLTNFSLLHPRPSANWFHYINALAGLVRSIGPEAFSTTPRRFILENNRLAMIQSASVRREACFLNDAAWKNMPWSRDPASKDDYQRLLDVYAEVPAFEAAVSALASAEQPVGRAERIEQVRRWLLNIQSKLHAWRLSVEPIDAGAMAENRLRGFTALDFDTFAAAEFKNTQIALSIVIFNLVLLVLHQYNSALGLCVFSHPESGGEQRKGAAKGNTAEAGEAAAAAAAAAAATPLQYGDEVPADRRRLPVLRADAVLDAGSLDRAIAASDEICACVPWILDKSGHGVGALYLLGALQVAIQAVGNQEPKRASWMRRILDAIQSTWNGHATWTMLQR